MPEQDYTIDIPLLPISKDGATITLSGDINYGLRASFLETLAQAPQVRTITLDSTGGNIFAARALAINISTANLNTTATKQCNSACTLIFLSGQTRTLSPNATLGFHGYRFDSKDRVQTLDIAEEEQKDRIYFRTKGVSDDFIDMIFKTPPNDLWQPSHQLLRENGILTGAS